MTELRGYTMQWSGRDVPWNVASGPRLFSELLWIANRRPGSGGLSHQSVRSLCNVLFSGCGPMVADDLLRRPAADREQILTTWINCATAMIRLLAEKVQRNRAAGAISTGGG